MSSLARWSKVSLNEIKVVFRLTGIPHYAHTPASVRTLGSMVDWWREQLRRITQSYANGWKRNARITNEQKVAKSAKNPFVATSYFIIYAFWKVVAINLRLFICPTSYKFTLCLTRLSLTLALGRLKNCISCRCLHLGYRLERYRLLIRPITFLVMSLSPLNSTRLNKSAANWLFDD